MQRNDYWVLFYELLWFDLSQQCSLNTLMLNHNGRHSIDDIFKLIFLNENVWIIIKISLKFVPNCPINSIPPLVHLIACRCPGDKPLSQSMMVVYWCKYQHNMLVIYIPSRVCLRWGLFAQWLFAKLMGQYIFSWSILWFCENICTSFYCNFLVGYIIHLPSTRLGDDIMVFVIYLCSHK